MQGEITERLVVNEFYTPHSLRKGSINHNPFCGIPGHTKLFSIFSQALCYFNYFLQYILCLKV